MSRSLLCVCVNVLYVCGCGGGGPRFGFRNSEGRLKVEFF